MTNLTYKPGDIIDNDFEILAFLGKGTFSSVYKIRNHRLNWISVLKLLEPVDDSIDSFEHFQRECVMLDSLKQHSNIVRLFSHGRLKEGTLYIELHA